MLDEFDVPNVGEAVRACEDKDTTESWERIKMELMQSQGIETNILKAKISAVVKDMENDFRKGLFEREYYVNTLKKLAVVLLVVILNVKALICP
jgi:hypothetical protein